MRLDLMDIKKNYDLQTRLAIARVRAWRRGCFDLGIAAIKPMCILEAWQATIQT